VLSVSWTSVRNRFALRCLSEHEPLTFSAGALDGNAKIQGVNLKARNKEKIKHETYPRVLNMATAGFIRIKERLTFDV
jgi:hypothetical protein